MKKLNPETKKYLIIGGCALGVYFLVKVITGSGSDNSGGAYDPTGNGTGASASNPNFNASNVANELYESMRYVGTNEARIMAALTNVGQADFAKVVQAFGNQSYNKTTGNQYIMIWQSAGSLPKLPLKEWMQNELSPTLYQTYRQKYPLYL